ncbi:MAG UNVERIFIED_CONTAM: hypothetical protein LVT10_15680 [Anaerolineae bacterium]
MLLLEARYVSYVDRNAQIDEYILALLEKVDNPEEIILRKKLNTDPQFVEAGSTGTGQRWHCARPPNHHQQLCDTVFGHAWFRANLRCLKGVRVIFDCAADHQSQQERG